MYSFARVSAVVGMRRQDYFLQGARGWLRLHEKGGKRHDVPAHHRAEAAVDAYLVAGGMIEDAKAPLFQSVDRSGPPERSVADAARGVRGPIRLDHAARRVHHTPHARAVEAQSGAGFEICSAS